MAGLRRTPLASFVVAVVVGRLARFAVLAWPVAVIASWPAQGSPRPVPVIASSRAPRSPGTSRPPRR